jgi:DNA adenine methylase
MQGKLSCRKFESGTIVSISPGGPLSKAQKITIEPKAQSEPLIKWPGGKRAIAHQILALVPQKYGTYYEPFLGGAALFMALRPSRAQLTDKNADLIECYQQVRDNPHELIRALKRLKNSEEDYYNIRDWNPRTPITRAARFLYLTRLAFNGIYRVNLRGQFNVPYGHKTHLSPVDEERLLSMHLALKGATLKTMDFDESLKSASNGDLIYLDPPYTVAHGLNGFLKYNESIFSWADQQRLHETASKLVARGCHVVVSNADHESVRTLYKNFRKIVISRPSVIAADAKRRRVVSECVFIGG